MNWYEGKDLLFLFNFILCFYFIVVFLSYHSIIPLDDISNDIIFNKRKRKSHGHNKEYNFIIKVRHENDNSEKNLDNKRYENNEYKQISTEVNILENDNKYQLYFI